MMSLIFRNDEEREKYFALAKAYFDRNPTATKFSRKEKESKTEHSFIKVGEAYYAMARGEYLGEGAFGKVKVVETIKGLNFAVKIEGGKIKKEPDIEVKVRTILKSIQGQMDREYGKTFKGEVTENKLYTIMNKEEGSELYKVLDSKPGERALSKADKIIVALKCVQSIQRLHNHRIIHGDIKPQNFMINKKGSDIVISSIDFGFSIILKENQKIFLGKPRGTPVYIAPEIAGYLFPNPAYQKGYKERKKWYDKKWKEKAKYSSSEYSCASDVYALGVMFKKDLELHPLCYKGMLQKEPKDRAKLDKVTKGLLQQLTKVNISYLSKFNVQKQFKITLDKLGLKIDSSDEKPFLKEHMWYLTKLVTDTGLKLKDQSKKGKAQDDLKCIAELKGKMLLTQRLLNANPDIKNTEMQILAEVMDNLCTELDLRYKAFQNGRNILDDDKCLENLEDENAIIDKFKEVGVKNIGKLKGIDAVSYLQQFNMEERFNRTLKKLGLKNGSPKKQLGLTGHLNYLDSFVIKAIRDMQAEPNRRAGDSTVEQDLKHIAKLKTKLLIANEQLTGIKGLNKNSEAEVLSVTINDFCNDLDLMYQKVSNARNILDCGLVAYIKAPTTEEKKIENKFKEVEKLALIKFRKIPIKVQQEKVKAIKDIKKRKFKPGPSKA